MGQVGASMNGENMNGTTRAGGPLDVCWLFQVLHVYEINY